MKKCPVCGVISDGNICPECNANLENVAIYVDEGVSDIGMDEEQVQEEILQVGNSKKSKRNKILIGTIIFVIIIIIAIVLSVAAKHRAAEEAAITEYNETLLIIRANALYMNELVNNRFGLTEKLDTSEELVNLTNSVWHDSIFDESDKETSKYIRGTSDFNEALNNLYADTDVIELNKKLYDLQETVSKTEIPDSLSDTKSSYVSLVTAYKAIVDWCESPTGSYNDYMSKSQEKFDAFNNAYNEFDIVCPPLPESESDSDENHSSEAEN